MSSFVSDNKCNHMKADGTTRKKRTVKLLVMKSDNELKFDKHESVCMYAQRKIAVLMRIRKCLDFNKLIILFQSQLTALTRMFHRRSVNNKQSLE